MQGPWPEVPPPTSASQVPKHFVAPPKNEVEHMSAWDFDSQHARVPWQQSLPVPPSVASCYQHMWNLGDQYEPWLQARIGYWQTRNDSLRELHPNWMASVAKERPGVAEVLPPSYHPDVHRELLRAAGANPDVVDEILMGFAIRGLNFSSGFYDSLPSISEEERKEMDLELDRSLHHGPSEVLRLLDRGSPGEGQQHVLEHTHKEHANGKFEPSPSETQWRIYKDANGNVVSNVPYDRYLPTLRFPCAQSGRTTHRGTTGP